MGPSGTFVLLDSITKPQGADGNVVLSGSHGGRYAAYLAARAGSRAIVLHDAGVGLDDAGIACIDYCQALGMAAATVDHMSARIGDADDMLARGRISYANAIAVACGVAIGQAVADALSALDAAPAWRGDPPAYSEGQSEETLVANHDAVACLDSASMVNATHAGRLVATGSHGGLIGGNPANALRADARVALFNDAGIGIESAGTTRLPALDARGVAAATVAASSARIGDGRSTLRDGELSAVNETARALGARVGLGAAAWLRRVLDPDQ